jgi:DNA-binding SARP family transcriptional activator
MATTEDRVRNNVEPASTPGVATDLRGRWASVASASLDVPPAHVAITVMGDFGVAVDGVPTAARDWTRRDAATLVKVLALAPGHRLHREHVMDLLWPDTPPARCAPRLHKAAHFARRATGRPDAIVLREEVVWLFPECEPIVDAIQFEQLGRAAVAAGDPDAAREALSWYHGELLPGDRYADWAIDRRELLHLRRLDLLRLASEWRELAELDPTDEQAHVQLMRRYLAAGHARAAIRQFEHLRRMLERHLSATPGAAARQARRDADHVQGQAGSVGLLSQHRPSRPQLSPTAAKARR